MVPRADIVEDLAHVTLQRRSVAVLGRHPRVLDQMPELLDAVQLRAVRRQEVQGHAPAAEHLHQRLDRTGFVDRGIVQNDRQGLGDLRSEERDEPCTQGRLERTPQLGTEDLSARQPCGDHVEALAACGLDAVLLADRRPRATVRMDLRESGFVQVRQFDLPSLGTCSQVDNLLFCLFKCRVVSFFLRLCRVRFQTNPPALRTAFKVFRCTTAPPASS